MPTTSRRVPLMVPITGTLSWDWRESYVVLLALVVPGVVLLHFPGLAPVLLIGLVAVGLARRFRGIARWWHLLRSGEVVTIDSVETTAAGNGTVRLAHATGWRVERGWFTGEITDSVLTYLVDDQPRTLTVRGLPYTSGIVLAHAERLDALCVSAFPFDIRIGESDRWSVSVTPMFWAGAAATTALYASLVAGAVISMRHSWF
ncbi:hypothetical protein [Rhodococcus sp. P1Y]|uniref:hypothetical protein n=1 Tax=Rhodococcus sp. P1Y TaxID=1302308 RepID=UPI001F434BC8|nr:hypothetical protein [Rhodococcus sp. P1Y]